MKKKTHIKLHSSHLSLLLISLFIGFCSCEQHSISSHGGLTDQEVLYIKQRQLLYYRDEFGDRGERVTVDPSLVFENPRLRNAYIALQAWKQAILSDPFNLTGNWVGSEVCSYTGVYCAPAPDNKKIKTVAGIDLNHGDIAGYLPEELGLLTDLALFHINSNRFCGTVPHKFINLKILFELDLSNNRFAGKFPDVVLKLPKLKFLDLRFNEFEGTVPKELFDKDLDAIFINHNRFRFNIPDNFGNSPVSVIVLANNKFHGCVPSSLGNMSGLEEIILMNNGFRSCLPEEIGLLKNLTVFDVSFNKLMGPLPDKIGEMISLEQLNVAHNMLSGKIPASICKLPKLQNFTFSYNFFTGEPPVCLSLQDFDDRRNCLPARPLQRSAAQCKSFLSRPVDCSSFRCAPFVPSLPAPPPPSPPIPVPSPPVVVPSPS
ncbi:leucine-rich repeat extensin-like protein 4, partial [Herrania umbratica]|uniref:Cell wall hydroxyproline-rich glycoprotein n=1 Tax=Herrania umbratica TaxID=108875 RepID=A0A6J0ZLK9_9ROSI